MEKAKQNKNSEAAFNAYSIVKGENPIQFRLIRLRMKGKQLLAVDVVLEEILPSVLGKAEQLLRTEGLKQ
jgi:hypothetical protein